MTGVRAGLQPEGREFPNRQLDGERMLGNDFFSKPYIGVRKRAEEGRLKTKSGKERPVRQVDERQN